MWVTTCEGMYLGADNSQLEGIMFCLVGNFDMKNGVLWMLRRVAFVRTDVSEKLSTTIIRVTRICELGT
jgi:hypothetical protein